MTGVVLWFLDRPTGLNVYQNVNTAYYAENGVYPTVDKQMAAWLTKNGWPCTPASEPWRDMDGINRISRGLRFTDTEALTALILRWG